MNRLGRNPFQQKVKGPIKNDQPIEIRKEFAFQERLLQFLQVDLPAESFIFGLKAALLLRSVWD